MVVAARALLPSRNHAAQHRADPDHPRRQPGPAARPARGDAGAASTAAPTTRTASPSASRPRSATWWPSRSAAGIDVVTDGELGKVSFLTYVKDRLGGFEPGAGERLMPPSWQVEIDAFPEYYADYLGKYKDQVSPMTTMVCTGPISYDGHEQLADRHREPARRDRRPAGRLGHRGVPALDQPQRLRPQRVLRAPTPTTCPRWPRRCARSTSAIVDAGFLLQVDDPWLIEYLSENPATTPEQRRRDAESHVEILNHALRGIPAEKIRLHTCYGLNHGPRIHDLAFRDIAPLMLKVNAGAYSFEVGEPAPPARVEDLAGRHAARGQDPHARACSGTRRNYVEHPELIADTHRALRRDRRAGERDRGRRLRLLLARVVPPRGAPDGRVGEVPGARRGRAAGHRASVLTRLF